MRRFRAVRRAMTGQRGRWLVRAAGAAALSTASVVIVLAAFEVGLRLTGHAAI